MSHYLQDMLSVGKSAHAGAWEVYPQDPHTYNDGRLGRYASFQIWMMSVKGAYIQAPLEGSRCAKGFGGALLMEAGQAIRPCKCHPKKEGRKGNGERLGSGSHEKVQAWWKESSDWALPDFSVAVCGWYAGHFQSSGSWITVVSGVPAAGLCVAPFQPRDCSVREPVT